MSGSDLLLAVVIFVLCLLLIVLSVGGEGGWHARRCRVEPPAVCPQCLARQTAAVGERMLGVCGCFRTHGHGCSVRAEVAATLEELWSECEAAGSAAGRRAAAEELHCSLAQMEAPLSQLGEASQCAPQVAALLRDNRRLGATLGLM